MDWPEPPRWLIYLATPIIVPLWALFILLWLLHDLVSGLWDTFGPRRDH